MPKIDAPTVAEHHAARRRALLDAAHELLAASPDAVPSLARVAERAGLARSSVYHYFASSDDLLTAMVEDLFPRWNEQVVAEMAAVEDADERVLAYVRSNLRLVHEGAHAMTGALARHAPAAVTGERMHQLHADLVTPLRETLAAAGEPDPDLAAELVTAVVNRAATLLEDGRPFDRVLAAAERAVRGRR